GETASQYITSGLVTLSAVLSGVIYWQVAVQGETVIVDLFTWISSGDFDAAWALRFDQLTAVMLLLVTGVAALVHWYSIGYMHGDPGISRFFSYLSLFTFAMLMLVTADNFLQMFFGWEGVGLCSYLLIGFWYDRPAANAAAIKAFVVNRVGDFGFALGIMAIFLVFRTIDFDTAFAAAPDIAGQTLSFLGMQIDTLTLITMLLFIGAMGKSAQLGLHTWLPDAMEGPTPVSALIHAATMVTAGVFMVARLSPIFEYSEFTLMVITIVGATTALVMASVGLVQNDIKRVIAYSTCSQLGYMFFAAGVSAYSASIFHLFTHGFFKALLFLSAGSVIHAMSDEQDMRKMGGLWNKIPLTYSFFWIGSLALAGLPFFAGFYSKDAVLESAWGAHSGVGDYAFVAGLIAAVFTAFYSWRLIFLTFHGESRASKEVQAHVHESPKSMTIPLMILAIGAIFAGFLAVDSFFGSEDFWGDSILILAAHHAVENAHHAPFWVKAVPSIAGIIGIAIAWWMYMKAKEWPHKLATWNQELYQLLLNKWYFDELYDAVLVRPMKRMGTLLWKVGDGKIIDGFGPDGISARVIDFARRTTKLQSGYVYHYAFVMLLGLVAIVSWVVATGGA
ncbi:MAG: NADH-quinone oxidoreductase subunit L, partial [Alphaproteobacteria bacterium]|nr:NADH-quinone oxidoreductase subunit L [Alphaproteobacteria bacterium]